MVKFGQLLSGGDLRSLGKSHSIIDKIITQHDFDELFKYLFHRDTVVVMRAADVIEKITLSDFSFLEKHKKEIFMLSDSANQKELKWHLALLIPRLNLDSSELGRALNILTRWAKDRSKSRIVRVNSIQGLYELSRREGSLSHDFEITLLELDRENIPSITARIKSIRKQIYSLKK